MRAVADLGRRLGSAAAVVLLAGCGGPQSALDPAGRAAERIATLFWAMTAGAVVIWTAVVGVAVYAIYAPRREARESARGSARGAREPGRVTSRDADASREGMLLIVGGGVIVPTVVLAGLLTYGLAMLPSLLAAAPPGSLRIEVVGEQWWWRVRYLPSDGEPVDLANELRLPVGSPVELVLSSPDVIHSLWIPSLAGKVDMIPGRTTRLLLEPTRTGHFRGVCAEYCGDAHTWMTFPVVVSEPDEFARWLDAQRRPAPSTGAELFVASGCGACHTIRGTGADGVVGPDLTHVGGRLGLGAGRLGNDPGDFALWIARTDQMKPGVHMPHFGMLPKNEVRALAAYLDGLT